MHEGEGVLVWLRGEGRGREGSAGGDRRLLEGRVSAVGSVADIERDLLS